MSRRSVVIQSAKGVGALSSLRRLELDVYDEELDKLLQWVTFADDHEHTESHLEIVDNET